MAANKGEIKVQNGDGIDCDKALDEENIQSKMVADIVTGDLLYDQMMASLNCISTGCSNLDDILGGGLYFGELTEIYGSSAVGKTQSCLSIACHVADAYNKNIVYIDTGKAFSSERVHEILMEKHGDDSNTMNYKNLMARIQCINTFDIFNAFTVLEQLMKDLSSEEDVFYRDVILVIFDSVADIITPFRGGTPKHHGHTLMVSFSHMLKSLACDYNTTVMITNNCNAMSVDSSIKPALGQLWSHVPNNRIYLHQDVNEPSKKLMSLTKSCRMPVEDIARNSTTEADLSNQRVGTKGPV